MKFKSQLHLESLQAILKLVGILVKDLYNKQILDGMQGTLNLSWPRDLKSSKLHLESLQAILKLVGILVKDLYNKLILDGMQETLNLT